MTHANASLCYPGSAASAALAEVARDELRRRGEADGAGWALQRAAACVLAHLPLSAAPEDPPHLLVRLTCDLARRYQAGACASAALRCRHHGAMVLLRALARGGLRLSSSTPISRGAAWPA